METIWFIIAGIVSGVVAGMGMGGGTLLIPILTIFFNTQQQYAQGVNLLAFLPAAIISLVIHIKNKLVDFKVGLWIVAVGVISSGLASLLAVNLNSDLLKKLFGGFLLLIGIYQLIQSIAGFVNKKKKQNPQFNVRIFTTKMFK